MGDPQEEARKGPEKSLCLALCHSILSHKINNKDSLPEYRHPGDSSPIEAREDTSVESIELSPLLSWVADSSRRLLTT